MKKFLLVLALLMGGLYFATPPVASFVAKKLLKKTEIKIDDIKISWNNVWLKDLNINDPVPISIKEINLNFSIFDIIKNQEFGSILIENAHINIETNSAIFAATAPTGHTEEDYAAPTSPKKKKKKNGFSLHNAQLKDFSLSLKTPYGSTTLKGDCKFSFVKDIFNFEGKLTPDTLTTPATLTASYEAIDGKLDISCSAGPWDLSELKTLSILLDNKFKDLSGHFMGSGKVHFEEHTKKISIDGMNSLKNVSFTLHNIPVKNINCDLKFKDVWPPKKPVFTKLRVGQIGEYVNNLEANFKVEADKSKIILQNAFCSIGSGKVSLGTTQFLPSLKETPLPITVKDVPFETLIQMSEVDNLNITGVLSGTLPLTMYLNHTFSIKEGHLYASPLPGILSFTPRGSLGTHKSVNLLEKALRNFHFDHFSLTVDKPQKGELSLGLDIQGKNPEVLKGRPFKLKFNVKGKLYELIEETVKSFTQSNQQLRKLSNEK